MKNTLIAGVSLVATLLTAADLPELVLPEGVGVNIHFTRGHEKELDLIAAAGFKFIRMDFVWAGIERSQGQYDWSAYEELTANLESRGLRALYILDYSNPLYEETVTSRNPVNGQEQKSVASPQHPESVAAFARWAAAAARHFSERSVIWEIWNEPNISFWKPKPDVRQYIALAQATVKAVRAADPKAMIIGPATSEVPEAFLDKLFAAGALEWFDAVSVHPYRPYHKGPETAAEDYTRLRALMERHGASPERKRLPIISGEWGYSTYRDRGVSEETQAAFLVRQQLHNLLEGVPVSIWYDWVDDGPDPKEREHNFGVVRSDLKPKPALVALQVMTRELRGFRITRRLPAADDKDYVLLLMDRRQKRKLAVWTAGKPHDLRLHEGLGEVKDVSSILGDGRVGQAQWEQGELRLIVGMMPQYMTLQP